MSFGLAQGKLGFQGLNVSDEVIDAALHQLGEWLEQPRFAAYRPQLEGLIARGSWADLLDGFYRTVPFGTGGRRGMVGIGPNRINPWTVATLAQGHVTHLKRRCDDPAVVLAYDVRAFHDLSGIYLPDRPNPVLGLTSRDFAEIAARVYAANGVTVWIQPRGSGRYMPTPELSFAIRALRAGGGLNISASHNPPDDNGCKVYDSSGAQLVPPEDEAVSDCVAAVERVCTLPWEEAIATDRIRALTEEHHRAYLDLVSTQSWTASRSARVVFTPLHGAGAWSVQPSLEASGFDAVLVSDQATPDGRFSTVPDRSPNPESPRALDRAIEVAKSVGAQIVLGTDPDADRIGCAVFHQGDWRVLTGNEIGVLVVHHVLSHWPHPSRTPVVIQTEVTSSLVGQVARSLGAKVVDHLLVGFKYIGAILRDLEESGRHGDLVAQPADFAVGIEESHGILTTAGVRDKDGVSGALALAEGMSLAQDRGETLIHILERIWQTHGVVANAQRSWVLRGAAGQRALHELLDGLRSHPPRSFARWSIRQQWDRRDPTGPLGPIQSGTDFAARNVLVFGLEGGAKVTMRPSGTEPKLKIYAEIRGEPGSNWQAEQQRVQREANDLAEVVLCALQARS